MKKSLTLITLSAVAICAALVLTFCALSSISADPPGSGNVVASAAESPSQNIPCLTITGEAKAILPAESGAFYGGISVIADDATEAQRRCSDHINSIKQAFSAYGNTNVLYMSYDNANGICRAFVNCKFMLDNIAQADQARTALIAAGATNVGNCEYYADNAQGKTKALEIALENATEAAGKLGGGRLVKVTEIYCYADGCSSPGEVVYHASVKATFLSRAGLDCSW